MASGPNGSFVLGSSKDLFLSKLGSTKDVGRLVVFGTTTSFYGFCFRPSAKDY